MNTRSRRRRIQFRAMVLAGLVAAGGAAAAAAGTAAVPERCSVRVGELDREFWVHVPASVAKDAAVPLVFVYHGGGGDARGTMGLTRFNAVADREGFIAVYPQGIGRGWNDGRETDATPANRDKVDDLSFFDAMLERISAERRIDPRRVFVTGISNGGIFSHFVAAQRSAKIAAIAPVVGGVAESFAPRFAPSHPVSVLVIQGTDDPLVPYAGGAVGFRQGRSRGTIIATDRALELWREADRIAGEPATRLLPDRDPADGCRVEATVWSGGRGGSEVWLYRVDGGGHTWPGGPQYLPRAVIGRVTGDIDSGTIWEFFASHPRRE